MSTGVPSDNIQSFYQFLGHRIDSGASDLTPEQSVQEFRAYQQELERFLSESQEAFEQSARGDTNPLDVDALIERVEKRLAEKGITD